MYAEGEQLIRLLAVGRSEAAQQTEKADTVHQRTIWPTITTMGLRARLEKKKKKNISV